MNDFDRIELLRTRLTELEHRLPKQAERSIVAVAKAALRAELTEIGQRLQRTSYWRPQRIARAG